VALPAALGLAGALVFLPALWAGYVADDFTLLNTVDGVSSFWSPFVHNDLGQDAGSGHFYRPLWVLWNTAIHELSGGRAAVLHMFNLALFALVCVAVWALADRLMDRRRAWIAALAFAVYPRHGESVAWISGNTDLLATAAVLGSLLALMSDWQARRRTVVATLLAVVAALCKESGFLTPLLAIMLLHWSRRPKRDAVVMAVALAAVLILRTVVVGGAGGYGDEPVTLKRVAASIVTYLVATVTPPQLEILHTPALAVVPLALATAAAVAVWRLHGRGESGRIRVVALGTAWFAVCLIPVLGEPLDLNNATGERLLFLPSVGLALAFAALVPDLTTLRRGAAIAAAAAVAAVLCLLSAGNWVVAGDIAEETAAAAARLAPPGGELVVLSVPESYQTAHVFTTSFDLAVARAGGEAAVVTSCIPIHVRHRRADQVAFRAAGRAYVGTTTWSAPFDFPVVGDPSPLTPNCEYARLPDADGSPGLELAGVAGPRPTGRPVVFAFFDGRSLERLR
jgi:hypothetical protein